MLGALALLALAAQGTAIQVVRHEKEDRSGQTHFLYYVKIVFHGPGGMQPWRLE